MKINVRTFIGAVLALVAMTALSAAAEKVLFEQDFESADAAKSVLSKKTVLSEAGPESKHCMSQAMVSAYNSMDLAVDAKIEEGAVLTFDYRMEARTSKFRYLGLYLMTADGKHMIATVKPSDQWKHAAIPIAKFRVDRAAKLKEPIKAGDTVNRIRFYGRGDDKKTDQTVWIDNVKIAVK